MCPQMLPQIRPSQLYRKQLSILIRHPFLTLPEYRLRLPCRPEPDPAVVSNPPPCCYVAAIYCNSVG